MRRVAISPDVFVFAASLAITLTLTAASWRLGLVPALFICLLTVCCFVALASPLAFAVAVLILAPLPSIGDLVGAHIPLGLDPLDVLALLGTAVAIERGAAFPLRGRRLLSSTVAVNLLLLVVAWYRTDGGSALSSASLGALVKPWIVVVASIAVVQLVPRNSLVRVVGFGIAGTLAAVAASVVLQRIGLYHTAFQAARGTALGVKQYGGLMLDSNSAGLLLGIYAVPAYLLLRHAGYRVTSVATLFFPVPVILVTLSRTAIAAYAASLAFLVVADRQRLRGARLLVVVGVFTAIWARTVGRTQVDVLVANVVHAGGRNAQLSGRVEIWQQAVAYLDQGNHWLIGGGIGGFQAFALNSPLAHDFATHSSFYLLLTTGGAVMLAAAVALALLIWVVAGRAAEPFRTALRVALTASIISGYSTDFSFFVRSSLWLWVLLAAACVCEAPRPSVTGVVGRTASSRDGDRTVSDGARRSAA